MRESILRINEETGEILLTLPAYEPDDEVTFSSLLFITLAEKITSDAEWVQALMDDAAKHTTPPVMH